MNPTKLPLKTVNMATKSKNRMPHFSVQAPQKAKLPFAEIITGVIIAAIILTNSVKPVKNWWESAEVNSAVDDVFYHLIRARSQAIKGNHQSLIIFNIPSNSYTLIFDKNNNGKRDATEKAENYSLEEGIVFSTHTGEDTEDIWGTGPLTGDPVQVEGGGHTLVFLKQGGASHSTAIYLMRREDVGVRNDFIRGIRVGQNGSIQVLKFDKDAHPPWY